MMSQNGNKKKASSSFANLAHEDDLKQKGGAVEERE